MRRNERVHAVEVFRLLNDLVGDLVITNGVQAKWMNLPQFTERASAEFSGSMRRVMMWHLIVSLSKLLEIYEHYHEIIPPDVRPVFRDLTKELTKRGVREFRNKVGGHVLDQDTGRPIYKEELDERLQKIFGGSYEDFLSWVNNHDKRNVFPETVTAIVQTVRDRIAKDYGLTPAELFPWTQTVDPAG